MSPYNDINISQNHCPFFQSLVHHFSFLFQLVVSVYSLYYCYQQRFYFLYSIKLFHWKIHLPVKLFLNTTLETYLKTDDKKEKYNTIKHQDSVVDLILNMFEGLKHQINLRLKGIIWPLFLYCFLQSSLRKKLLLEIVLWFRKRKIKKIKSLIINTAIIIWHSSFSVLFYIAFTV